MPYAFLKFGIRSRRRQSDVTVTPESYELDSERAGKRMHESFCAAVEIQAGPGLESGGGGDIKNAARARRQHCGQEKFSQMHDTIHVDMHHAQFLVNVGLSEWPINAKTGIVHEYGDGNILTLNFSKDFRGGIGIREVLDDDRARNLMAFLQVASALLKTRSIAGHKNERNFIRRHEVGQFESNTGSRHTVINAARSHGRREA